MSKELVNATRRELDDWPGATVTEEDPGKHGKLVLHFGGESRMIVVAKTPSDVRALPNHLALVRRELRVLGASKAHVFSAATADPGISPVLRIIPDVEDAMQKQDKIDAIFKAIEELRYADMIDLATYFSLISCDMKLRRGVPQSWAQILHAAAEQRKTA